MSRGGRAGSTQHGGAAGLVPQASKKYRGNAAAAGGDGATDEPRCRGGRGRARVPGVAKDHRARRVPGQAHRKGAGRHGDWGHSYDDVLAEKVNGLDNAEVRHAQRIWEPIEAVELTAMARVPWRSTTRGASVTLG